MVVLAYVTFIVYVMYLLLGLRIYKRYLNASPEDFTAYLIAMAGVIPPIILSALVIAGK